ncbi:MAG: monovalent cation/H+ antiporter subunit E [Rubrivivax sp.]|nr:monovalent cation/H+ antiporter subunit E [Rubrivivax sp.]
MKRWLPSPWLSLALFVGWQLLARGPSADHILLGGVVALAMPLLTQRLRPRPGPLARLPLLVRLILRVGLHVLTSSAEVAYGVLRAGRHPPRGAFADIPLELRDEHSLAALAMIVTVVPGTVWCELAPDRSVLRLHVFALADEAAFVTQFRADYVLPLKEIFE